MARITVSLPSDVSDALWMLAERECRHPRDQAALLIRLELERRGLLPADAPAAQPQPEGVAHD
jgi:hypothetical protein